MHLQLMEVNKQRADLERLLSLSEGDSRRLSDEYVVTCPEEKMP